MFRKLPYKTGSFPTGVSTLLLTLPVLTGERSQTYIKYRKPLCKAVFAHSLDILRLNYRHSRNLRHHSISLQYAFTRKIYYTAFRCGIQAFFKISLIEFRINSLRIFMQFDEWYYMRFFCSYSAFCKHVCEICGQISDIICNATQRFDRNTAFFGRGKPLPYGHTISAVCFSIRRLPKNKKTTLALRHDRPIIFFIALCDPAVALSVAYRQHLQRWNCQRRPAITTLCDILSQKQRQP